MLFIIFGLPHFRLMMSAVPGVPTHLWFRSNSYNGRDEKKKPITQSLNIVLACNKLCGSRHYNMKKSKSSNAS